MEPRTGTERDGALIETADGPAVRFARRLAHAPERVWRALTDRAELAAWFPADIEGELTTPGASLSFPFREGEGPTETGTVLECEPPSLLAFTWGEQTLRYELSADGNGTVLVFTHALPRPETAHTAAGWELCFDQLDSLLAGGAKPEFAEGRWRELHDHYAAEFGVDPEEGLRALEDYKRATEPD